MEVATVRLLRRPGLPREMENLSLRLVALYRLPRIWYVVLSEESTADMQLVWLTELPGPTAISQSTIDETHESRIPAWGETIGFDEVGKACHGQAQMTFNYRGQEVIK
jgi:hypothetical protein